MEKILDTERLTLRTLTLSDASFMLELVNTPGWLEFIGDKKIRNEQDAIGYIQNGPLKSYSTHGFGLWLVELKGSGTPIGLCGLLKRDYLTAPDIGFAFLPAHTGKGYALESVTTTRDYAIKKFAISTLYGITLPHNERSIKLLKKIGLSFDKRIQAPGDPTELHLYQTSLLNEPTG